MTKKKLVTLQVEVPCYTTRKGLKCADTIVDCIEQLLPPVRESATPPKFLVRSVAVR